VSAARQPSALVLLLIYAGVWLIALVGINLLAMGAVGAWMAATGDLQAYLDNPLKLLTLVDDGPVMSRLLAVTLLVQFPVMFGVAELCRYMGDRGILVEPGASMREVYAWRSTTPAVLAVGAALGLTAGWLPGWIAGTLRELLPMLDLGALGAIQAALTEGPLWTRVVVVLGVAVGAPVVEELVFRGFMWWTIERALGPIAALVGSSLLFGLYHMDPVQAFALLFTAFVLGWVRRVTGSIFPCIALHAVNNSLGVVGAMLAQDDGKVPLPIVLGMAATTIGLAYLIWRVAPEEA
jgi:hypothetical protein